MALTSISFYEAQLLFARYEAQLLFARYEAQLLFARINRLILNVYLGLSNPRWETSGRPIFDQPPNTYSS